MRVSDLALLCALTGCAAAPPPEDRPEDLRLPSLSGSERPAVLDDGPARLTRSELDGTVRAGLGAFLSRVRVEPAFNRGRFVGWRLDGARHLARWNRAGMPLRRGDVIVRVNGGSLERPDDALAVFAALRGAHALTVEVLRDGRALSLRLDVAE